MQTQTLSLELIFVLFVSQEPVLSKEQPAFQYSSHVSLQAPSGHMWWVFFFLHHFATYSAIDLVDFVVISFLNSSLVGNILFVSCFF